MPNLNHAGQTLFAKTLFAKTLLVVTLLVAAAVSAQDSSATARAESRPNVLFIAIDDLNDWLGCLGGHPQVKTPNIDRLAERGVLFTNAHCAAPVCNASRAAIFTGRQPFETGIYGNSDRKIKGSDTDFVLLPRHFKNHGYRTFGTGKLLHSGTRGLFDEDFFPHQRWSPFNNDQHSYTKAELPSKGTDNPRHVIRDGPGGKTYVLPFNRMPSDRSPDGEKGESFDWHAFELSDGEFGDGQITDWAIERIHQAKSEPFFLAVGYYRPHIPLYAPQQDFDQYPSVEQIKLPPYLAGDLDDLGTAGRRWAVEAVTAGAHSTVVKHGQWKAAVRAYLACITFVDRQIGRLLGELDRSPHAGNTIVVLWGDHGWHLGEKQHWGKWTGWQRSTRVPLLVAPSQTAASGSRAAGAQCHQPVTLIDIYPTLSEMCGLSDRPDLSGESLVPLLADPQLQTNRVVVTTFDRGNVALSGRRFRYLKYKEGEEELYDLQNDPHEWNNLAGSEQHQTTLKRFRQKSLAALPN